MILNTINYHSTARKLCHLSSKVSILNTKSLNRRFLSIKVAIVGSGPAGFYTTQKLLRNPDVNVDIYEKLPVPFGLVRYGVAPDHQDVKNVINSFTSVANSDRVNFYGNIDLGRDVSIEDLADAYHAVVLCYGSAQDKLLDIEGEKTTKNTISARNFVGWYNGLPEDKDLDINLDCETACIIGQGNVAIDCARILLKPKNLDKTDITSYAQRILSQSKIRKVYIIGRRGPMQVSFTTKELRELIRLNGDKGTRLSPESIFEDVNVTLRDLMRLPRHRRRLAELLLAVSSNKETYTSSQDNSDHIQCIFKFLSKPLRIIGHPETGRVCQLELKKAQYSNVEDFMDENARPDEVDDYEAINCGLIIRSIGFKAVPVHPSLPMDTKLGAIINSDGRIQGHNNLYCSGWLATGATGVIAGTLNSSQTTAQTLLEDIRSSSIPNITRIKPGHETIGKILARKSIQVVHFNDWLRIDEVEKRLGEIVGKSREKLVEVDKMLKVARGDNRP